MSFNPPMILRVDGADSEVRVNRTFTEELGFECEELGGQLLLEWVHPDDRRDLKAAVDAGEGCAVARPRTTSGDWVSFRFEVKTEAGCVAILGLPVRISDVCAGPTLDDVQPRITIGETLEAMVRVVEGQNPGMRCSILLVDANQEYVSVGAGPSLPTEYNDAVEGLRIGPTVGSCGTAAFWNVPVVVENIGTDPLWKDLRGAAAIAGVSACWSQPVTAANGTVLGAMALYNVTPRVPTQTQMDGLKIAARMVGLAVERDRLEEQLNQAAKMEALGVLAGGIAHDFNNLLAVILGNAELALAKLPPELAGTEMLKEIASASISATDLCSQLLAYAGLEPGKPATRRHWNRIPQCERARVIEAALADPEKSPRELAWQMTDRMGQFISESSVYRILKAHDLITSPAYVLIRAADRFQHPTKRPNELW